STTYRYPLGAVAYKRDGDRFLFYELGQNRKPLFTRGDYTEKEIATPDHTDADDLDALLQEFFFTTNTSAVDWGDINGNLNLQTDLDTILDSLQTQINGVSTNSRIAKAFNILAFNLASPNELLNPSRTQNMVHLSSTGGTLGGIVAPADSEYHSLIAIRNVDGSSITLVNLAPITPNYQFFFPSGNYILASNEIIELYYFLNKWYIFDKKRVDASDIIQTSTGRLVTDVEKSTYAGKQNALGFTPENTANKNANNGYLGANASGNLPVSRLEGITYSNTLPVSIDFAESRQFGQTNELINTGSIVFASFSNAKRGNYAIIIGNFATYPISSTEDAKVEWIDGMGREAWTANTVLSYIFTFIGNNEVQGQIYALGISSRPANLRNFDVFQRVDWLLQMTASAGFNPFLFATAGTGNGSLNMANETDAMRYAIISTGSTNVGRNAVHTGAFLQVVSSLTVWEAQVLIPTGELSNGTDRYYAKVGFEQTVSAEEGTDIAHFYYRDDVNSGRWQIKFRNNSGVVTTVNLAAEYLVVANTKYRLRVELDGTKSTPEARCYINNTLVHTQTGVAIPFNRLIGGQVAIHKTVGIAARTVRIYYPTLAIDNIAA
ncbi:MAG: hypothetical protein ACRC78_21695, partial [Planktothrix sp.]